MIIAGFLYCILKGHEIQFIYRILSKEIETIPMFRISWHPTKTILSSTATMGLMYPFKNLEFYARNNNYHLHILNQQPYRQIQLL